MKDNNKIMEAQIVSGKVSPNQIHLTSDGVVADVLNFGYAASTAEIMWLHAVPLHFKSKIIVENCASN